MIDPSRLSYKPGWVFKIGGPLGRYLCVYASTTDSENRSSTRLTQHMFEIPADGFTDDRGTVRWVFDCLLLCELHEAGEFFEVDGHAPFFPNHQDEGSPYEPRRSMGDETMNTPTPGLNPTTPGLRTVRYDARSAAKVSLIVQPGDTLLVPDDVAEQLAASSAQFKTDAPVELPVQADESIAEVTDEATVSDTPAAKSAPRKRAAKLKS